MSLHYQSYQDYKEQTKESFSLLQYHVSNADEPEIDAWFEQHFSDLSSQDSTTQYGFLFRNILNAFSFFAFSSTATDRESIESQQKIRHLAVLKHFPAQEQLGLIHNFLLIDKTNLDADYFNLMDVAQTQALTDNGPWFRIVSNLFYLDKFSLIDFLESRFETPFLDLNSTSLQLHYQDKNSRGYTWVKSADPVFKPYSNIIYAYSEDKDAYLNEKNIAKPSYDDVNLFKQCFMETSHSIGEEGVNNLFDKINPYQKMMHYYHLNTLIESEHENTSTMDDVAHYKGAKI